MIPVKCRAGFPCACTCRACSMLIQQLEKGDEENKKWAFPFLVTHLSVNNFKAWRYKELAFGVFPLRVDRNQNAVPRVGQWRFYTAHLRPCLKKSCGKHRCNKICCPERGIVSAAGHMCTLVCGKPLRCGKHNCEDLCHRGHCQPCLESVFDEVSCHCGAVVLYPPVGCGTALPDCVERCVRPQACGHPAAHSCHHDDVPCPPCPQLVNKMCVGGHAVVNNVRCHTREVLCGRVCNKLLDCGHHTCPANCHSGSCNGKFPRFKPTDPALWKAAAPASTTWDSDGSDDVADNWEDSEVAEDVASSMKLAVPAPETECSPAGASAGGPRLKTCGLKCNIIRPCGHPCAATCHPGRDCPPIPCRSTIQARCTCGHRREMVECRYGDPNELGFGSFGTGKSEADAAGAGKGAAKASLSLSMQAAMQATLARVPPRVLPCNKRCDDHKREAVSDRFRSSLHLFSFPPLFCLCPGGGRVRRGNVNFVR